MKNWMELGKNWRCSHCLDLLEYLEIWQDPATGEGFCKECWMSFDSLAFPRIPALVCDECGTPIKPSTLANPVEWKGLTDEPILCEFCKEPLPDEEIGAALGGFLKLLEATGEEG